MKIKFLRILFVVSIFGIQNAFAQVEASVAKIRADVAAISKSIAKYKRTKKSVEGISLEGTQVYYYSSENNLKKVTAKIYGETYRAAAEIYCNENKPIFVYQKLERYETPFNQSLKIVGVEETRAYYTDGKIFKVLAGRKELNAADEKYKDAEKDFEDMFSIILTAFKN